MEEEEKKEIEPLAKEVNVSEIESYIPAEPEPEPEPKPDPTPTPTPTPDPNPEDATN